MKFTDKYFDLGGTVYYYDDISKLPRTKENALLYTLQIICRSWTFARLTGKERETLINALYNYNPIGNINQRLEQYFTIQHAFLLGLGYTPIGWREATA